MIHSRSAPALHYTLRQLARQFHGDWNPDDWFRWPPDLFALTSTALRNSGVYRCAVAPPDDGWDEEQRRELIGGEQAIKLIREWREWILGKRKRLPQELRRLQKVLFSRSAKLWDDAGKIDALVCQSLLSAHALADGVCAGFGLSWGARPHPELGFVANFHLAVAGSLSLCAHHHGFVLPKMRTPQRGLTIRSFSHHLSFHQTEAVVHWWTLPWFDREADENSVNVLAVPLPYTLEPGWFQPTEDMDRMGESRRFGYFRFDPGNGAAPKPRGEGDAGRGDGSPQSVREILGLIRAAYREVVHLHLLVLPEVALTQHELDSLRSALVRDLYGQHNIPMIVSGVRRTHRHKEINEVVISAFYADRWYELRQHKHHRWKLTRSQIQQYALGGYLSVQQEWWEAMDVPPRRLTFLTPTGWLSLSPLICEDLAQLEPLSDLIRGVGPTLVTALLLDGPQLPQRWPARYAGVLADDPGSSVLTVTSLGMARRCRDRGKPVDSTAVSWKDEESGWEPVKFAQNGGVLLSLKAEWREEFTADGRSDHGSSAHMVLQSARELTTSAEDCAESSAPQELGALRKAVDVLELTVFCYLVDAVVDVSPAKAAEIFALARLQEDPPSDLVRQAPVVRRILTSIRTQMANQHVYDGEEVHPRSQWPEPHFEEALGHVERLLESVNERYRRHDQPIITLLDHWKVVTAVVEERLHDAPSTRPRAEKLACYTVLWAIHSRLMDEKRRLGPLHQDQKTTAVYIEVRKWLRRIEALVANSSSGNLWSAAEDD